MKLNIDALKQLALATPEEPWFSDGDVAVDKDIADFVSVASPFTILDLIARIEAAETALQTIGQQQVATDWTHEQAYNFMRQHAREAAAKTKQLLSCINSHSNGS